MKKLILLLSLCLLCTGFLSAEREFRSYFGEEFTKWYVIEDWWDWCTFTSIFFTCRDCTEEIDGVIYQRVYMFADTIAVVPNDNHLVAYFREDTSTGQLFLRVSRDEPEVIISDMSLEVGDLVPLHSHIRDFGSRMTNVILGDDNMKYVVVDKVHYIDGLRHIRTTATFWNRYTPQSPTSIENDTLRFVEGIGSNIGPTLFHPAFNHFISTGDATPKLMCYKTESELIRFALEEFGCFTSGCWSRINSLESLGIRKEITSGILNLFFDEPFNGQVRILDISGKLLYRQTLSNETNFTVNVSSFPQGVYILQVEDINKGSLSKKIIIN